MKLSKHLLSQYTQELHWSENRLTMAGLEIENVTQHSNAFKNIVVGQVLEVSDHPNADRLRCCKVCLGSIGVLNIVCGASNIKVNAFYPVANVGAVLPSGLKIKPVQLRGVESVGMLCSAEELGFQLNESGIWDISHISRCAGQACSELFFTDDKIYEFDLTPNRGDCLSYLGMSREISALHNAKHTFSWSNFSEKDIPKKDRIVRIDEKKLCPAYMGVCLENIETLVPLPFHIIYALSVSGIGIAKNAVVDILNYVMLLTGQPMHAFDDKKLGTHELVVRYAKEHETMLLLNNLQITLSPSTLVVAANNKPVALAGVMGNKATCVDDTTTSVWLESAFFTPDAVAGKTREYNITSEAAYRFERGVDFKLHKKAMLLAVEYLKTYTGATALAWCEETVEKSLPTCSSITFSVDRANKLLGVEIEIENMKRSFLNSEFECKYSDDKTFNIAPPSHRFDIKNFADLLEEVARFTGYENIPTSSLWLNASYALEKDALHHNFQDTVSTLVALGYQQVINYSFIHPKTHESFFPNIDPIVLMNPMIMDQSVMRFSLIPGLLQNIAYNLTRQQTRFLLYEHGNCFYKNENAYEEKQYLAGACAVSAQHSSYWCDLNHAVDFFTIKAHVERVLAKNTTAVFKFKNNIQHPWLVKGASADIVCNGLNIGYVGMVQPSVLKRMKINVPSCFVFEVDSAFLSGTEKAQFKTLPTFSSSRRDVSFSVNHEVEFQDICDALQEKRISSLRSIRLIDYYCADGATQKNLTIRLFMNADEGLKTTDIDTTVNEVMAVLKEKFAAEQRMNDQTTSCE